MQTTERTFWVWGSFVSSICSGPKSDELNWNHLSINLQVSKDNQCPLLAWSRPHRQRCVILISCCHHFIHSQGHITGNRSALLPFFSPHFLQNHNVRRRPLSELTMTWMTLPPAGRTAPAHKWLCVSATSGSNLSTCVRGGVAASSESTLPHKSTTTNWD